MNADVNNHFAIVYVRFESLKHAIEFEGSEAVAFQYDRVLRAVQKLERAIDKDAEIRR